MNYRVGSIIEYKTFTGELRRVRVTEKVAKIKNGFDGFDAVVVGEPENTVWGYDDQITRVVVR